MPDSAPPDFLAIANKMPTHQLERSVEFLQDKAEHGDTPQGREIAQNMLRWTQDILADRAKSENQLALGADGHTYTQREYYEKQVRDNFEAGLGALRGNFGSFLAFNISGDDAGWAGIAGGLFGALGAMAKSVNESRAQDLGLPQADMPRAFEPPDVEPGQGSAWPATPGSASDSDQQADGGAVGEAGAGGAPGPSVTGATQLLEGLSWQEVKGTGRAALWDTRVHLRGRARPGSGPGSSNRGDPAVPRPVHRRDLNHRDW